MIIENAGSGTPLIQDLVGESLRAIPFKPEGDKALRMSAQSAKIEAGHVFLPNKAPWLDEFETEVMAFPHGAHDDQVDLMAQALDWVSRASGTRCGRGISRAFVEARGTLNSRFRTWTDATRTEVRRALAPATL